MGMNAGKRCTFRQYIARFYKVQVQVYTAYTIIICQLRLWVDVFALAEELNCWWVKFKFFIHVI